MVLDSDGWCAKILGLSQSVTCYLSYRIVAPREDAGILFSCHAVHPSMKKVSISQYLHIENKHIPSVGHTISTCPNGVARFVKADVAETIYLAKGRVSKVLISAIQLEPCNGPSAAMFVI